MSSNAAFAGRAIFSKNLMNRMSAVNLYNYVTIVALLFCIPPTLYVRPRPIPSPATQCLSAPSRSPLCASLLSSLPG